MSNGNELAFTSLLKLWSDENSLIAAKLQLYIAVSTVLVGVYAVSDLRLFSAIFGAGFSAVWFLYTGRTLSFKDRWEQQLSAIWEADRTNAAWISRAHLDVHGQISARHLLEDSYFVVVVVGVWRGERARFLVRG